MSIGLGLDTKCHAPLPAIILPNIANEFLVKLNNSPAGTRFANFIKENFPAEAEVIAKIWPENEKYIFEKSILSDREIKIMRAVNELERKKYDTVEAMLGAENEVLRATETPALDPNRITLKSLGSLLLSGHGDHGGGGGGRVEAPH